MYLALLIGKTHSFYHPEARTLPQQHRESRGMYTSTRCSGSRLLKGFSGSTEGPQPQPALGFCWALGAVPGEWWGPVATLGGEAGREPPADQTCAAFRSRYGQASIQLHFCLCELIPIGIRSQRGSRRPAGMAQCWSPAADIKGSSQVETLCVKSGRDSHMPTSYPTTACFQSIRLQTLFRRRSDGKRVLHP